MKSDIRVFSLSSVMDGAITQSPNVLPREELSSVIMARPLPYYSVSLSVRLHLPHHFLIKSSHKHEAQPRKLERSSPPLADVNVAMGTFSPIPARYADL